MAANSFPSVDPTAFSTRWVFVVGSFAAAAAPRRRYFPEGGEHKHPSVFRAAAAKGGRVAVRARLARFAFILCSKTSCNASRHLFSTFCIGFFFLPANVRSRDLEIATYVGDRFRTMTLRVSRSKLAYGKDRLNAARGVWQGHVDKVYDN